MAKVTIDDKVIEYTGSPNLIVLAKENGIDIPHFCYHPALPVSGNCRMCLVEVGTPVRDPQSGDFQKDEKGNLKINYMPKPQPACYQQLSDGMVIKTNTEKIMGARRAILEFILANHPLDCPVCDQAGECVLQDYSFQYGFSNSQFYETKRLYKKNKISDVITQEMNRCIHCTRCARFTTDIAGENVFGRTWRGNRTELATVPGDTIKHNYQGNMVDICPVGALTLTDFRFKSRIWFLKYGVTLCTSCGKGCNVLTSHKDNKVYRLKPAYNEKVNRYWMCDFGRLRYKFLNENRRDHHLIKGAQSGIGSAVQKAADILKSGKDIAVIASANESLESNMVLARFFRDILPTSNLDYRIDGSQIKEDKSLRPGELLWAADPYPNSQGARQAGLVPGQGGASAPDVFSNPDRFDVVVIILDDKILEKWEMFSNLSKVKNLIIFSPFASKLDTIAQVAFATKAYTESSGSFINIDGILQSYGQVMPALGDAEDLWAVISLLSDKFGKSMGLKSIDEIRSEWRIGVS